VRRAEYRGTFLPGTKSVGFFLADCELPASRQVSSVAAQSAKSGRRRLM